jgi:hypothetical protein
VTYLRPRLTVSPSQTGTFRGIILTWWLIGICLIVMVGTGVVVMQVDSVVHIIDRLEQARHGAYLSTNIGER